MKNTTVRIPEDVQEALSLSAGRNYRSLHGEILEALRFYGKMGANITSEEKDHLFYNGVNYKKLAKTRKEQISEQEETIKTMGRYVSKLEEIVREVRPEYFEERFAKDQAEEEAEEINQEQEVGV
jgi:hemerythrin superfamily protein